MENEAWLLTYMKLLDNYSKCVIIYI